MNQSCHLEEFEHFKAWNPSAAELVEAARRDYVPSENITDRRRMVS